MGKEKKQGKKSGKVQKRKKKYITDLKKRTPKSTFDIVINDFVKKKDLLAKNYPKNINRNITSKVKKFGFDEDGEWDPCSELQKYDPVFKLKRPKFKYAQDCSPAIAYFYVTIMGTKLKLLKEAKIAREGGDPENQKGLFKIEDVKTVFDREKGDRSKKNFEVFKTDKFELKMFK